LRGLTFGERWERKGMAVESSGRDLFIVDNSISGWTGLRYLEEWTGIAKACMGYDASGGRRQK